MRGWGKITMVSMGLAALACGSPTVSTPAVGWSAPEFIAIPAGTFQMGIEGDSKARPHEVTVSAFEIMKTEVTVAQWQAVMGALPMGNRSCRAGAPCPAVQSVAWPDAIAFANAASLKDGLQPVYTVTGAHVTWDRAANGYRLPTEAEWEYAARGPSGTVSMRGAAAGWCKSNSEQPRGACEKPPSGYGACDMLGNVAELVYDSYDPFYPDTPQTDPVVEDERSMFVALRGGSYVSAEAELDPSRRSFEAREKASLPPLDVGLRLARSAR